MKRTFHVWNRELKSVTQIILNTSFWENFTENGRSQIFTFFEKLCWKKFFKRWRFIAVHYAQTSFVQVVYFFIHCKAVKHPYSISYFFKPKCTKEDCLLFILVPHWCFFVFILYMLWTPIEIARGRLWPAKWLTRKCFPFILVS